MDVQSFNNELGLAQLTFGQVFTGSKLIRQQANCKPIYVPCVFGQRSRILKNLENPGNTAVTPLPVIVITRRGFTRDPSRVANLHLEKKLSNGKTDINPNLYTPQPINISYEVSVITKYPGDMDQILSNFLVVFNQDIFVKFSHPKLPSEFQKSQIVWDGSVNEEWPEQLDMTKEDIQICSTSFIYKTYLYGGISNGQSVSGIIKNIGFHNNSDYISIDFIGNGAINLSTGEINYDLIDNTLKSAVSASEELAPTKYYRGKGITFYSVPMLYSSCDAYLSDIYANNVLTSTINSDSIPGRYGFTDVRRDLYELSGIVDEYTDNDVSGII